MEEQNFSKLKLSFEHNVTKDDVEVIQELATTLEGLNKLKLNDNLTGGLEKLGKSLQSFKGISVGVNLGKGITGLVDSVNAITEVKDITPYAQRLNDSFKVLREASAQFQGNKASIGVNLGRSITGLVDATNKLQEVKDIKPYAENLSTGFDILSQATAKFAGVDANIGVNLGRGITGIVEAINSIENVKDISLQADNLRTGFHVLGFVSREFNQFSGRIPVNLGRGISGIIEAVNGISEVKDISPYSDVLKRNFKEISEMARNFEGLNNADYSGISKLVTSMSNIGRVEFVGDNVVKNAEQLAKAIEVLGNSVTVDTPKMEAMSKVAKQLGFNFKTASTGTDKFGRSLGLLNFELVIRNIRRLTGVLRGLASKLYGTVDAFGDVENTLSFFSQSLGSNAQQTAGVIQQFADAGVINFTKFANQTARLNQIYKGYGIQAEDAAKMALNMTQLAYDASFALGENGKDIDLWMQRATSVATGQTRSGYYFGVDTSVQSLSENFDGMSANADKATRSMAAYNTMIENTTSIQGQLSREQMNTYVQMDVLKNRIELLKQSIGRNLLPAFQGIIRHGLVAINVVVKLLNALSLLFGGEGFELIKYEDMIQNIDTGVGDIASGAEQVADGMSQATKQAKELKKTITGIDQVFTINDMKPSDTGGTPSGTGGVGGLGDVSGYDWTGLFDESLDNMLGIEESAEAIYQWIKAAVPYAVAFGGALAAWKISKSLMNGLKWISSLKGIGGGLGLDKLTGIVGLSLFLDDLRKFKNAIDDIMKDGANFDNVARLITSFTGMVGDALIVFGQIKIGGALKVVQGLADMALAVKDMSESGINWNNVQMFVDGLTTLGVGIGLLTGNWEVVGWSMAMKGIFNLISEIGKNWEAIKQFDFSGLDKEVMITGVVMAVGGIAVALGKFKKTVDTAESVSNFTKAPETVSTVSEATGGVSGKLVSLAKNLALGLVILAEVAAATVLFVKAVRVVGDELVRVGEAWQPVIDNGATIAAGIALGTALLVGVGGATYALGTVTIASGGTIPLAIGAGTAMLVLLSKATKLFIKSLTEVAKQLTKDLAPELDKLNAKMPTLNAGMENFTNFMIKFAGQFVTYSASSAVSGIAATISTVIGWFTKDPIKKMADDVKKNGRQFSNLNEQFRATNPLISRANDYMRDYERLLSELEKGASRAASVGSPTSISRDFKAFSRALKEAFDDLNKVRSQNVHNIMGALNALDLRRFRGIGTDIVKSMELGMTSYKFRLGSIQNSIKYGLDFNSYWIGYDIARGVESGINGYYPSLWQFTERLKRGMRVSFEIRSPSRWARDVIGSMISAGVETGINDYEPDFDPFKDNVFENLQDMADQAVVKPKFEMPTLDTKALNGDISGISRNLNAEVQGRFDYENDKTEQAIMGLTNVTVDKLERLIQAVEDGKVIEVDGEVLGEVSDKYIKEKSVRMNTVFGR